MLTHVFPQSGRGGRSARREDTFRLGSDRNTTSLVVIGCIALKYCSGRSLRVLDRVPFHVSMAC